MCLSLLLSFSSGFPKIRLNSERELQEGRKNVQKDYLTSSYDAYNFSVEISRPLGIVLESIENSRGAIVAEVLEGGNASKTGKIDKGDILISIKVDGCYYHCGPNILFDNILECLSESPDKNVIILNFSRARSVSSSDPDEVSTYWEQKKEREKVAQEYYEELLG